MYFLLLFNEHIDLTMSKEGWLVILMTYGHGIPLRQTYYSFNLNVLETNKQTYYKT